MDPNRTLREGRGGVVLDSGPNQIVLDSVPNQNCVGFGTKPNCVGFGTKPNCVGFGTKPNCVGFGTKPNCVGFGTKPNCVGFGTKPNRVGFGTKPNRVGFGTKPNCVGFGTKPNCVGFGTKPNRVGFGTKPNCVGFGTKPNCVGFGSGGSSRVKRIREVHFSCYCSARMLTLVKTRDHTIRNGEQGRGDGVPCWEERVPSASMMDGRWSCSKIFTTEQRDGALGAALVSGLSCLQDQYYEGVLPNCRDVNSGNWEVEKLRQAVLNKIAEVEHNDHVRPLGGGRTCLPFECPIVLGMAGSELPVEGLCNCLQFGVGFSLEGDWYVWWETRPLAAQFAQAGPVALGV